MRKTLFTLCLCISYCFSYGQTSTNWQDSVTSTIQQNITAEGKQPVSNFLIYLENEASNRKYHEGLGNVYSSGEQVDERFQFKTASITKTFVAAIALQLVEEEKIDLDELAHPYLSKIEFLDFKNIHQIKKERYANQITIRQLLNHRTGLADVFKDADTRFLLSLLTHKKRSYTVEMFMDKFFQYNLHKKAHFKPGEDHYYSDTNYVLLGLLIEQIEGATLPAVIRKRILEPLQMEDTYFEYYEDARGYGKHIDAMYNRINFTQKINTSYEWAGGGLVSTTGDLATFLKGLFDGTLVSTQSLELMKDKGDNEDYSLGLIHYEINEEVYYGHGGFFGSVMFHNPIKQITFIASIGQANATFDPEVFVSTLIAIVE